DARAVGVIDAEDEDAAVMPCEEPVEERGARVPDVERSGRRRREPNADLRRDGRHVAATIGFDRTPIPAMSTSTESPGSIGPTPAGVPVMITSPGSRVITRETNDTKAGGSKMRFFVFDRCFGSPLSRTSRSKPMASMSVSIHGP